MKFNLFWFLGVRREECLREAELFMKALSEWLLPILGFSPILGKTFGSGCERALPTRNWERGRIHMPKKFCAHMALYHHENVELFSDSSPCPDHHTLHRCHHHAQASAAMYRSPKHGICSTRIVKYCWRMLAYSRKSFDSCSW